MVSFAAVGFVLASKTDLLAKLINPIVSSISDLTLARALKKQVQYCHSATHHRWADRSSAGAVFGHQLDG